MRWSRHALGFVAILAAATTFGVGAVSGLSYVWCGPMGEARLRCCCPVDEELKAESVVRRLCCEGRELAELPPGLVDDTTDASPPTALPATSMPIPSWPRLAAGPVERMRIARPAGRARASPARCIHRDCSVYLL